MRLKKELSRAKKNLEQPFGQSTPSSKQLVKPSAPEQPSEEQKRRMGGAKPGHVGHGRMKPDDSECNVEDLPTPDVCPCCGEKLVAFDGGDEETRDVVDCELPRATRRRYRRTVRYCPHCKKPVRAKVPGVLPKSLLSNNLLATALSDHYLRGITIGTIANRFGVNKGTLIDAFSRVASFSKDVFEKLGNFVREAPRKHADETGWRNDGRNGYAWVSLAANVRCFYCETTRAGRVAKEILGVEVDGQLMTVGELMTDRYGAYNFFDKHFYCLEHLKRDVLKIVDDNPDSEECRNFADRLASCLRQAMKLRGAFTGNRVVHMVEAARIRGKIEDIVNEKSKHPSIQNIQTIFRENDEHLWGWETDPNMPAENNIAERAVRPLVIARKVSHGSQSDKGREIRSVLTSIVQTLANSVTDVVGTIKHALDVYADNSDADMFDAYFGKAALCVTNR